MSLVDVIQNDSDQLQDGMGDLSILAWKHGMENFRDGSLLIVAESEEAVFVRDGIAVQVFPGGRYTLETANHPFLTQLRIKLTGGHPGFSARVYFVNRDHKLGLHWGTDSPIQVRDPVLGIATGVQARGAYSVQVRDSKKLLIKLIGNNIQIFTEEALARFFRDAFLQTIKDGVANALMDSGKEILHVANRKGELAGALREGLRPVLDAYGLDLVNFYVSSIDIPDSEQRSKLEAAYGDVGVMNILGDDWNRQQAATMLRDLANNPGAGGVAAAGAGAGLGMAAGSVFGTMAEQMFRPVRPQPEAEDPRDRVSRFLPAEEKGGEPCWACQHEVPSGARFCGECGKAQRLRCAECGTEVGGTMKFCSECGAGLLGGRP